MLTFDWLRSLRNVFNGRSETRGRVRSARRPLNRRMANRVEALETRLVLAEDFGDAPDTGAGTGVGNYETLLANNGPRHTIVAGLKLGANVDGEANATANAAANGDGLDEDGVSNPAVDFLLTTGAAPTVTLLATNTTGAAATLFGWIDTNGNGAFDNATERASVNVPDGTTNGRFTLNFPTITTTFTGTTYARFRLSTDVAAANSTGAASDGEVEDYAVRITRPTTGVVKTGGSTKIDDNTTNGPALADRDQFGGSVARIGDIDGDGVTDLVVGAQLDDTGADAAGTVYVLRMNADGTVKGTTKIASGTGGGPTLALSDFFGYSTAPIGDIDGDGIGDIAVGAPRVDIGAGNAGAVYLLRLNSDGTVKSGGITQIASGTNGGPTLSLGSLFGSSVAAIGDINGDGVGDLAVGAIGENSYRGAVYILLMNPDGTVSTSTRIANEINGGPTLASSSQFGISLAGLGDFDGDNIGDVVIGYRGGVYVARLSADGSVQSLSQVTNTQLGISTSVRPPLATAGDLDGNGVTDLLVGSEGDNSVSSVFLHADGTLAGSVRIASGVNGGPSVAGTNFGSSVTSLGDFDGDGVADILVGARLDDAGGPDRGAVYILRLDAATFDFGDAPDTGTGTGAGNYATTLADGGPRHIITAGLQLGAAIDAEPNATANAAANGDGLDEDGVLFPQSDLQFTIGAQPSVTVRATNTTGTAATLYGWVDYNANGAFDDASERAQIAVPDGTTNGSFTLTFPTVPAGFTGTTYARFRLSTDTAASSATGVAINGEVEDYTATIVTPSNGKPKLNGNSKIADNQNGGPSLGNQEQFGTAVVSLGDLDGDGIGDIAVGAQRSENPDFRGAVYIQFLNANGSVKATTRIGNGSGGGPTLNPDDFFGSALANLGDIDGDGVVDLAVGSSGFDGGGVSRGAVYILRLNTNGTVKSGGITRVSDAFNGGPTLANFVRFGNSVANLGDVDGDGLIDLAVGAYSESTEGTSRGAVYVLRLSTDGSVKLGGITRIASGVNGGPTLGDRANFGHSVTSLGDFDGDGIGDLAVGALRDSAGAYRAGAVYILRLNADGTVKSGGITQITSGTNGGPTLLARDYFGSAVANVGDLDGDGVSDLVVGAYGDDTGVTTAGAVYVLRLNADGTVKTGGVTKLARNLNGGPTLAGDRFGSSAASLGDFDADGVADLIVGAVSDASGGGSNRGAVHILRLDVPATPTALGLSANTIAENQPIGTAVGTFSSTDANPFDTFTYTLVTGTGSTDNGSFQIVGNELRSNAVFDFETKSSYAIRVRTTDDSGRFFEQMFTITISDVVEIDFGDAPDTASGTGRGNYETLLANNGPRHTVVTGLKLGSRIDGEADATQTARANGDDTTGALPIDEDGVINPRADFLLTTGTQPTITLRATNTTGTAATLYGWVDTNGNGVFDNASERASVAVPSGTTNGTFTLTFPVVPTGFTGTTYARFRLSTDVAAANSTGTASDGEVEDYAVTIVTPSNGKVKPGGATKIASGGTNVPTLANYDSFGGSVANMGDLDGDGVADLAVGARFDDTDGENRGAVHILFLNADGTVKSRTKIASGTGGGPTLANNDLFGRSVANLGDLDGDGVADLAVGADRDDTGGDSRGAVYVLFLNASGTVKSSAKIASEIGGGPVLADIDSFGSSLANVGDLDGDGVVDLAVGARQDSTGGGSRGAVHILFLNASGTVKSSTKIASEIGGGPALANSDLFGFSVANLGDVDGDGVTDLAVGAYGDDTGAAYAGAVHILLLNSDGTVKSSTKIASGAAGGPTLAIGNRFGSSVAHVGDLNGDGVADLAVGAFFGTTAAEDGGVLHILFLNADGTAKLRTKIASQTGGGPTLASGDFFGFSAVNLGDLDGDGVTDLAVGAPQDDTEGGSRGAVHILRLEALATPTALALSANSIAGNQPTGTAIGTFSTTDANANDSFTYTLVTGMGATDNGSFQIVGNELQSNAVFNFATKSSYSIRVRTTDDSGLFFERMFTINIREPQSFVVTTSTDVVNDLDGLTSLREALAFANSDPDTNTITFGDGTARGGTNFTDATPDTILLTGGELAITTSLTITGNGAASTIIDGGWDGVANSGIGSRIFLVDDSAVTVQVVTISGLTLQKAYTGTGNIAFNGAAIRNSEQLTISDSVLRDSYGHQGVGVSSDGALISNRNTYTNNRGGDAGGIHVTDGTLVSTGDAFTENVVTGLGGGILVNNSFNGATLINSTIANNNANAGGGIFAYGPTTTINVTIANNTAAVAGGFFAQSSTSTWNARNTIVAGNSGGDVFRNGSPTIVADRLLVGDNSLSGSGITSNVTYAAIFGTNVLANNGGPTQTIALSSGSAAINAGSNALALDANSQPLTTDQRGTGFSRILGGIVDIGAFERPNSTPTNITLTANSVAENAGANVVIGALAGVDPDPNDALTLSLPAGLTDNALFNLSGGNLRANASFNFEAKSSYTVTVRVTDFDGLSFDRQFTISVTDVNEAPTAVALQNTTTSLPENTNTASAIKLADIVVTDDALGTNALSLSGTDAAFFEVVGTALRQKAGTVLNFEVKASYSVTVRLDDSGVGATPDATVNFTLTVTDVNEAPTAVAFQNTTTTLPENMSTASAIKLADIVVTDDALGTNALSLSGTDAAFFEIVGTELRLRAGTVLNFEPKSSYSVIVQVDDPTVGATPDVTVNYTLTVTNTNDAPVLDVTGSPFVVLGVGARQSLAMQQGVPVSELLSRGAGGDPISDEDSGALTGIALTSIDRAFGTFQYTLVADTPAESDWIDVEAAGAISESNALLLPAGARLRFKTALVPHHEAGPQFLALESKLDAGLTFRAWDRTSGSAGGRANTTPNGGSTAFSTATETSRVYFEARLYRHYNRVAGVNVDTLQAEFDEIQRLANINNPDAFEDRANDAFTGFSILMSAVPELSTVPVFRLYFGVQFNEDGTETDMGYRYLTTNRAEAEELELLGPADRRAERAGTYFREIGINGGTGIIGYIYSVQQPGTSLITQIYRTDLVDKPTRPAGTEEGATPSSFRRQESGDHVYTSNIPFESARTGTWRIEAPRGFARELSPNATSMSNTGPSVAGGAKSAGASALAASFDSLVVATPESRSAVVPAGSDQTNGFSFVAGGDSLGHQGNGGIDRLVAIPSTGDDKGSEATSAGGDKPVQQPNETPAYSRPSSKFTASSPSDTDLAFLDGGFLNEVLMGI
jgi:hypothetical protein